MEYTLQAEYIYQYFSLWNTCVEDSRATGFAPAAFTIRSDRKVIDFSTVQTSEVAGRAWGIARFQFSSWWFDNTCCVEFNVGFLFPGYACSVDATQQTDKHMLRCAGAWGMHEGIGVTLEKKTHWWSAVINDRLLKLTGGDADMRLSREAALLIGGDEAEVVGLSAA